LTGDGHGMVSVAISPSFAVFVNQADKLSRVLAERTGN
jgi:hypothetical protein